MTAPTLRHTETRLREAGDQAKDLSQTALEQGEDLARGGLDRGQELAQTAIDQGLDLAQSALEQGQELAGELNVRAQELPHDMARGTRRMSDWVYARRRPLTYLALGLAATVAIVGIARLTMSSKSGAADAEGTDKAQQAPLAADDGPLSQRAHDAESAYPSNEQPAVEPTEQAQRIQRGADEQSGDEPVKAGDVIPSGRKK